MAAPVVGGVHSGRGGVSIHLVPPVEFILRQSGRFRAALLDLQPLWELFKPVMEQIETEQFDTEGHGQWPALAESTLRYRGDGPMLVQTGALRDSLTSAGAAAQTSAKHMEWGSSVFYAVYHQQGTSKMPMRQVIPDPFPAEQRQKLEAAMLAYINGAARLTFGRIAA